MSRPVVLLVQGSKFNFSKSRLLATFNCKMVAIKKKRKIGPLRALFSFICSHDHGADYNFVYSGLRCQHSQTLGNFERWVNDSFLVFLWSLKSALSRFGGGKYSTNTLCLIKLFSFQEPFILLIISWFQLKSLPSTQAFTMTHQNAKLEFQ